mmetsp:Transcript_22767/g.51353  ORF Transcript_22767/g.51353 Transcript_22767/m.51353 type:complete len:126 (-) Transcript_22767:220-597(-)
MCVIFFAWCAAVAGRDSLDRIVALVGCTCGAPLALVLPYLLHSEVLRRENRSAIRHAAQARKAGARGPGEEEDPEGPRPRQLAEAPEKTAERYRNLCLNAFLLGIGAAACLGVTGIVLYTWNDEA